VHKLLLWIEPNNRDAIVTQSLGDTNEVFSRTSNDRKSGDIRI